MQTIVLALLAALVCSSCNMSASAQALLSSKVLDDVLGSNTYSPRYTFNNGVVEAGKFCSPKNWNAISDTMTKALNDQKGKNRRRQLVRVANRALSAKCSSCSGKPLCLFQSGIGCARIYGGRRHRQLTLKKQSKHPQSMRLMQDVPTVATNPTICADSIAAIDAALAALSPKLAPSCQAILNGPRLVECIEFSPNCSIDGFAVVPAASSLTAAPIDLDMSGTTSFCRSAVGAVNIETKANFDMGTVVIKLFGPKKGLIQETIASDAPFFLYNATAVIQLVPATYTVQALAIVVGKGQVSHKQTTFTVKDC